MQHENQDYKNAFLEIMDDFRKHYSYYMFKRKLILHLQEVYTRLFEKITDDKDFLGLLVRCFSELKDAHIIFFDKSGNMHETYTSNPDIPNPHAIRNYNTAVTQNYFPGQNLIFRNELGFLGKYTEKTDSAAKSDIHYISVNSWDKNHEHQIQELINNLKLLIIRDKIDKLIIDVRANGGGDANNAKPLLSLLIPKGGTLDVFGFKKRTSEENPQILSSMHNISVSASPDANFEGKIVCLIGNCCVSSNEAFVSGIKSLGDYMNGFLKKKIWLVGDRTFGASASAETYHNATTGISYWIPSWIAYTADGEIIQWNGILPDIHVSPASTISGNTDKAFERAIKLLKE